MEFAKACTTAAGILTLEVLFKFGLNTRNEVSGFGEFCNTIIRLIGDMDIFVTSTESESESTLRPECMPKKLVIWAYFQVPTPLYLECRMLSFMGVYHRI